MSVFIFNVDAHDVLYSTTFAMPVIAPLACGSALVERLSRSLPVVSGPGV